MGRVKREKLEDGLREKISVYISKTESGDLRIKNKSIKAIDRIKEINEEIHYPPQPNKGISLWSISRFIKSMISTLLTKHVKDMNTPSKISVEKLLIEKYMGEAYDVIVGQYKDKAGEMWFYLDIPILAQKYTEFEKYIRR